MLCKFQKRRILMKGSTKRLLSLLLFASLSLGTSSVTASAADSRVEARATMSASATDSRAARIELGLLPVSNRRTHAYSRAKVTYGTKEISEGALLIGTRVYISVEDFVAFFGGSVTYDATGKSLTARYLGMTLTVNDGAYVTYVGARPIFSFSNSVVMSDGEMYMPLSTLAKSAGLSLNESGTEATLSGNLRPMSAKAPYTEDEIFWLARIIQAESSGESLLGKIGVGTVVMNRVRSPLYPNTIWGVIFDRNYGVQFSPILNGTIYNTPNYQSRLAAMICLEGFSISPGALFFLEPRLSTSSWIPKNRKYLFSILHHDFYA